MDRYLYVLLDTFGKCWVIKDGETEKVAGLPSLMREGWKPLRRDHRSSPPSGKTYMLIVLERDSG